MSKCDYCDNTNSCRTCGLTYDDGVKDGRKQAIKELINFKKERDSQLLHGAIMYAVEILERKFADDMTSSHSEEMIYKGCLDLMEKMVDYFHEYIEYLGYAWVRLGTIGYDLDKLAEDERFAVEFMPTEIVRKLFLSGTGHDGGTSCRMKCKELGIEADKPIKFDFGEYIETPPEKYCGNCGQPRDRGKCIPYAEGKCKSPYTAWIPKERKEE